MSTERRVLDLASEVANALADEANAMLDGDDATDRVNDAIRKGQQAGAIAMLMEFYYEHRNCQG